MERMGLGDYHKKKQTLLQRKKAFDCCFCDLVFSSKNLYHEHIQTVHEQTVTGSRRFIMCACSECGKLFHNKSNLSRHMENTHRQTDEIFTCDLCDQQCKSKLYLKKHIRMMHVNRKSNRLSIDNSKENIESNVLILCPICQKEFSTQKQFDGHKKSCSLFLEKNIEILNLGEESIASENYILTTKVNRVEPKVKRYSRGRPSSGDCGPPYICDICGKSFPLKGHIYNHMTRSHFKTPGKKQSCNLCGATVLDMKAHMFVHSLERPFTCDFCNSKFKKSSHLSAHRLIHTGEKPHVCSVCSKAFVQLGDMYKHARRSHHCTLPRIRSSLLREETVTISIATEESVSTDIGDILEANDVVEQTAFIIESDKDDKYGVSFV